jgi:hypothetical protein
LSGFRDETGLNEFIEEVGELRGGESVIREL